MSIGIEAKNRYTTDSVGAGRLDACRARVEDCVAISFGSTLLEEKLLLCVCVILVCVCTCRHVFR